MADHQRRADEGQAGSRGVDQAVANIRITYLLQDMLEEAKAARADVREQWLKLSQHCAEVAVLRARVDVIESQLTGLSRTQDKQETRLWEIMKELAPWALLAGLAVKELIKNIVGNQLAP